MVGAAVPATLAAVMQDCVAGHAGIAVTAAAPGARLRISAVCGEIRSAAMTPSILPSQGLPLTQV